MYPPVRDGIQYTTQQRVTHLFDHVLGQVLPRVHAHDGPGQLLVAHLQLGQQDVAVLGAAPVYHSQLLVFGFEVDVVVLRGFAPLVRRERLLELGQVQKWIDLQEKIRFVTKVLSVHL